MRAGRLTAATWLGAVLLGGTLPAGEAAAQGVDDCMEASPARAPALCRALIDAGRGNADVWTQLALSLDKNGRGAQARSEIDTALTRYPRDADLLALRERLAARGTERERLERAGRRNVSAVAQGELKLLCRTRTGVAAIEACRRYLAATDVDGERIRTRLAELERAAPDVAGAPAPPTPDRPRPIPLPEPSVEPSGEPVSGPTTTVRNDPAAPSVEPAAAPLARTGEPLRVPDPEAELRRERVASIQRALNALGQPAGRPDGIAGQRTREALASFDRLTGREDSPLDESTLAALEEERLRLTAAEEALVTSRTAASDGRFDEAIERLGSAESASALLRVPPGYRNGLEQGRRLAADKVRLAQEEEARRLADAARRADAEALDASPTADVPDTPVRTDALAGLLTRIGTLERQLAEADGAARRDAARLRDAVQRTLDAP